MHMSAYAKALLFDLCSQLHMGKGGIVNNGDLCLSKTTMEKYGWKSCATLHKTIRELEHYGMITLTRRSKTRNSGDPNLYSVDFLPINECRAELDVPAADKPNEGWKSEIREEFDRSNKSRDGS